MAFGGAGPVARGAPCQGARPSSAFWCRAIPASSAPWGCCSPICAPTFATTRLLPLEAGVLGDIEAGVHHAETGRADSWFAHEEIASDARRLTRTVDMRYAGQNYELAIPAARWSDHAKKKRLICWRRVSPNAHQRMYGFLADKTSRCSSLPFASRRPASSARRR